MKIHSLNCGSFCPANLNKLWQELENFKKNYWSQKIQDQFVKFNFFKKINNAQSVNSKFALLKSISENLTEVDFSKEKIFSQNFQELVTNVLLIECDSKLILLDTGIGKNQLAPQEKNIRYFFSEILSGIKKNPDQLAVSQIKKLGFSPSDITDVVVTHLDHDHVGGLVDFPQAQCHLYGTEIEDANFPRSFIDKKRFIKDLWNQHRNFYRYVPEGEDFFGFKMTPLKGIKEDIFLLNLFGHTLGHAGVYIKEKKYIFAGDSFLNQIQLSDDNYTPVPIKIYSSITTKDQDLHSKTISRLKNICAQGIHIGCSHDQDQFLKNKNLLEEKNANGSSHE
jgi:glyoxylase-like metal-dependent hydrolase (beta-lactamase superfamily II)